MRGLHVLWGPGEDSMSPWEPAPATYPDSLVVDCCACRMPRENVERRYEVQKDPSYYDPILQTRCRPGTGCDANPRRRFGADLRRGYA